MAGYSNEDGVVQRLKEWFLDELPFSIFMVMVVVMFSLIALLLAGMVVSMFTIGFTDVPGSDIGECGRTVQVWSIDDGRAETAVVNICNLR